MSYQKEVFNLLAEMSGTQNVVAVPRMLCKMTGSLEGGMFLSQLIYWADKGGNKEGWFYKSYPEWYEECFLSEYQIRKLAKDFADKGFLETTLKKANGSPTLHYRVNKSALSEWILKNLSITDTEKFQEPPCEIQGTITKTTTKTTPKITTKVEATPAPLTDQQEWFKVVCAIVAWDAKVLGAKEKAQVAQTITILKNAGYTLEEAKSFLEKVWMKDWRYKKDGQMPTLTQLRTEIGKLRNAAPIIAKETSAYASFG